MPTRTNDYNKMIDLINIYYLIHLRLILLYHQVEKVYQTISI